MLAWGDLALRFDVVVFVDLNKIYFLVQTKVYYSIYERCLEGVEWQHSRPPEQANTLDPIAAPAVAGHPSFSHDVPC